MTVKPQHQIVAEQLNALLDQVEQGPWDHYAAGRDREAIQAATAIKDYAVRYKVVGNAPTDDFDRLGQQFAEAGRAQSMVAGGDKTQLMKAMEAYIAQLRSQQAASVVEQKRVGQMDDPPIGLLNQPAKKSYDVNTDLVAQVNHADQLGR